MQPSEAELPSGSRSDGPPHCHVPATFEPEQRELLATEIRRLIRAAEWLTRELDERRGCHAALAQVAVLQADLDTVASRLVDGHLRYCVAHAVAEGQRPDEILSLLVPIQSVLFARRQGGHG